jgi:hypothetical protein
MSKDPSAKVGLSWHQIREEVEDSRICTHSIKNRIGICGRGIVGLAVRYSSKCHGGYKCVHNDGFWI